MANQRVGRMRLCGQLSASAHLRNIPGERIALQVNSNEARFWEQGPLACVGGSLKQAEVWKFSNSAEMRGRFTLSLKRESSDGSNPRGRRP